MVLLAAAPTTLEKLQRIPPEFWWKLAGAVLALAVLVFILRRVVQMNKVVLAVIGLLIFSVVGVNWVYERNEPAFLTPLIDKIAPFLPSKGAYRTKQAAAPGQQDPKRP